MCHKHRFQLHMPLGLLDAGGAGGKRPAAATPARRRGAASSARWWFYTAAKAREQIGFTTRPLDDSIRDTAAWLKRDGYHQH